MKNNKNQINILGVKISTFTKKQALAKIQEFLADGRQHYIVTPNAEIILQAIGHDEELFYILNKADLSVLDGSGPQFAAMAMGHFVERYPGADLLKDILELAAVQGRRVVVFNWHGGLSSESDIQNVLADKYSKLQSFVVGIDRETDLPEEKLARIKEFQPEIIFSTLGAPYQEKFIYHNLSGLASVKIGIGVGGAFDFLTGKLPRAPFWLRTIGLEWLWRLIKQPRRRRRIYNAVVIFPYKFFLWCFILPWLYRENVVCLLYKRENLPAQAGDKFKILIVERADSPGHWQLPQGGTEGENIMTAGLRELSEEINTDKFKPVAAFDKLHQYEFGNSLGKFMVPAKRASGYKGQKQSLFIAEFTGADADIKVNFWEHQAWRWVEAGKLVEAVHPIRQQLAKIFMEKFNKTVNII